MQLGKRSGWSLAATGVSGPNCSCLFYVTDKNTQTQFLVDTGSKVSVLSPSSSDRKTDKLTLLAVNDTPISTYGKRSLTLNVGLQRSLPWIFIIADVQKPILGADFLRHFELLVDVNRKQLIDTKIQLHIQGILSVDSSLQTSNFP